MASLRNTLFAHPEWSKYFFEGEDPREDKPRAKTMVGLELVCDEIVDLADTVIEQRRTVPGAEMDWSTWEAYLRDVYQNSPLLKRYLQESIQFYPDYVLSAFGYIIVRDEDTGEVQSEWSVDEWRSARAKAPYPERLDSVLERWGIDPRSVSNAAHKYPWFRTWVITRIGRNAEDRGPRLVAVTDPVKSDPERANVRFAWCESGDNLDPEEVTKQAKRHLQDWVLVVLQTSGRLKKANVKFDSQTMTEVVLRERARWRLPRLWDKKRTREQYLAPTILKE
jgi:hypothetical protein